MNPGANDVDDLVGEHLALLRHHGQVQARCSDLARAQAAEIDRLQAQVVRLRATVIARTTALAWAAERHAELEAAAPGLPRRLTLARRVDALLARVQELLRERMRGHGHPAPPPAARVTAVTTSTSTSTSPPSGPARAGPPSPGDIVQADLRVPLSADAEEDDLAALEDSLGAADLVICQTGCLSHGAYWRVQDHCQRTGKACVLVERPDALRIMRIHPPSGPGVAAGTGDNTSGAPASAARTAR